MDFTDASDTELERAAYGRGHSPEEAEFAAAELRLRRSSPQPEPLPEGEANDIDGDDEDDEDDEDRDLVYVRPVTPWRAGVAWFVAGAAFAGAAAVVIMVAPQIAGPSEQFEADSSRPGESASLLDSTESPSDSWFEAPQSPADELPVDLPVIDSTSTRLVDYSASEATRAWLAQSEGGEYCLVLETDVGASSFSWSCVSRPVLEDDGVEIANDDIRIVWTGDSVQVSPSSLPEAE